MFLNSLRINLKNIYYAYYILNFKVINILFKSYDIINKKYY